MPYEGPLYMVNMEDVEKTLEFALLAKGRKAVLLAVITMFECLVILASDRDGYDYAKNECLRVWNNQAFRLLKTARNLISHACFDTVGINKVLRDLVVDDVIYCLYVKAFPDKKRELRKVCNEFNEHVKIIINPKYQSTAQKILELIPPALRAQLPEDETEAALQYAYDMIAG